MSAAANSLTAFPPLIILRTGLERLVAGTAGNRGSFNILNREPCEYPATFRSEIVTCVVGQGVRPLRLLCKYADNNTQTSYGHRLGVSYEAEIYQKVLASLTLTLPQFQGWYEHAASPWRWMALEYLQNAERLQKTTDEQVIAAAQWAGTFHAMTEGISVSGLNSYTADYYKAWAERTLQFARDLSPRRAWLESLCHRFTQHVPDLLDLQTIVHGEYYPLNILVRDGAIYPVDWESAAVAAGEIDLASLTEGWEPDLARKCELAYQQARWKDAAPDHFDRILGLCRMYLHFRWLGDRPAWTHHEGSRWRFEQLYLLGQKLCLI